LFALALAKDSRLDGPGSIPGSARVSLHCVHTGSVVHAASGPMGTEAGRSGFDSQQCKSFSSLHPHRLCGPRSLRSNGYGGWTVRIRLPAVQEFHFTASTPALSSTQPPVQWVRRLDGPGSIPSSARVSLHCVHTDSVVHAASGPMGTGCFSPGV
jgi:hypothetical protein